MQGRRQLKAPRWGRSCPTPWKDACSECRAAPTFLRQSALSRARALDADAEDAPAAGPLPRPGHFSCSSSAERVPMIDPRPLAGSLRAGLARAPGCRSRRRRI